MDLITTNKQVVCILGDYKDKLKYQLQNFEGGMHQFNLQLEIDYQKKPHFGGGIMKISWILKLSTFPAVIVWIYDITEPQKLENLLDNYNQLKQTISLAKKFSPKIIIILTGKNVSGQDFNYLKKEIDLRKVFAIEFETIGQQLKRIKKMIIEDSNSFYQELYNRYKNEANKMQKTELSDQKLIIEIKKTLISEIENNQKKTAKHLQASYEIVTQLAAAKKQGLYFKDSDTFYISYELILQAEEYREIADQLRFKLFRNLDYNEIINQFDIHFKTFKNLVYSKLFEVQEYLWRVKIFVAILKFLEARLQQVSYIIVYNYLQGTLLAYLKLQQLQNLNDWSQQIQQIDCQIYKGEPEYVGRPNYILQQNDQRMEIKSDQKRTYYEHIMNFRRNEIKLVPNVDFIFDIWRLYSDSGQQYQYASVYFTYLKILITQDYELRNQISDHLIHFGLVDEYKYLTQLQFENSSPLKQIQLHCEMLMMEQSRIEDIKKLSSELTEHQDMLISTNNLLKIYQGQSMNDQIELILQFNINQSILDIMEEGQMLFRNGSIQFNVTNKCSIITDKIIEKPVSVKLKGKYMDKLTLQIISDDVDLVLSNYSVNILKSNKKDPPVLTIINDIAYINELNEIQVELSYETGVELLNYNQNREKLLIIKENNQHQIRAKKFTLLCSDPIIHDYIVGFKIEGEEFYKKIRFQFPFSYQLKIKQLGSVYQNAQNRNKATVSSNSKCILQLEVKNIKLTKINFVPEVDLDFQNTNKQNVIFQTREQNTYTKFGVYHLIYLRNKVEYQIKIDVQNINVVSYLQDVQISAPPTCKTGTTFEMQVKLKTRETQNFFIQLKDQDKKAFFIMGKVKQFKNVDDEAIFTYMLFPIEIGRCNLPGIQVEIRQQNQPSSLVFDSTGMKSILILP